ncbi:hypothetical protein GPJ56_003831 [Histomonas meleagridis]|uniref:uncharacterized protein n=1 Tax=Histomonas meleagridis TaxID=135588 RepID=UPI00355A2AC7|nr:hypothetical protein GPJ56_003831 [Histomonas meleagridis]KAH0805289.1 hypothetical protein GO595_002234 [Histomonas meleagridis]
MEANSSSFILPNLTDEINNLSESTSVLLNSEFDPTEFQNAVKNYQLEAQQIQDTLVKIYENMNKSILKTPRSSKNSSELSATSGLIKDLRKKIENLSKENESISKQIQSVMSMSGAQSFASKSGINLSASDHSPLKLARKKNLTTISDDKSLVATNTKLKHQLIIQIKEKNELKTKLDQQIEENNKLKKQNQEIINKFMSYMDLLHSKNQLVTTQIDNSITKQTQRMTNLRWKLNNVSSKSKSNIKQNTSKSIISSVGNTRTEQTNDSIFDSPVFLPNDKLQSKDMQLLIAGCEELIDSIISDSNSFTKKSIEELVSSPSDFTKYVSQVRLVQEKRLIQTKNEIERLKLELSFAKERGARNRISPEVENVINNLFTSIQGVSNQLREEHEALLSRLEQNK